MKQLMITACFALTALMAGAQARLPAGWELWTNKNRTITLGHPKEWRQWDFKMGEIVSFITPKDDAKDDFPDGLVLIARPNTGNKTLDEISSSGNKAMSQSGGIKIISGKKLTLGKRVYYKNVLASADGKWVQMAYIFIKNGQVYFLQLTTETRNHQKMAWIGDEAFKSLVVK